MLSGAGGTGSPCTGVTGPPPAGPSSAAAVGGGGPWWGAPARQLPDWLAGLAAVGTERGVQALSLPLPTFRAVPKGVTAQWGDLVAEVAEELCERLAWREVSAPRVDVLTEQRHLRARSK